MKRFAHCLSLPVMACLVSWALPGLARADLASDVDAVLADKLLKKTTTGIEVYRLGNAAADLKEVFNLHAQTPLTPASNLKVATTSAALDKLGPDFRFRTLLVLHDGDLILIGDGDPTFGDAEYLRKAGWGVTTVFDNWAGQLKKLNVTSIRNVIVDDSVFDENFTNPRWPGDARRPQYISHFEAEVAGMNLNLNCIDFSIAATAPGKPAKFTTDPSTGYTTIRNECLSGSANAVRVDRPRASNQMVLAGETPARGVAAFSITIHDPSLFAATVLSERVAAAGIKVTGSVQRDRTIRQQRNTGGAAANATWPVIAVHETPMPPVLARCNKDSVNLYAESLCKRVGFESQGSGSWATGTAAVGAFLMKTGVAAGEFNLDDGSGLSRANTISPHALAKVLAYDFHGKNHEMFFASLSIAGVDGTLNDRFEQRDMHYLQKRVFGKSGFIEGVSTVCGYLKAKDDKWYVFSIMMNGIPHGSNSEIKVLQEKIIKAIDVSTIKG